MALQSHGLEGKPLIAGGLRRCELSSNCPFSRFLFCDIIIAEISESPILPRFFRNTARFNGQKEAAISSGEATVYVDPAVGPQRLQNAQDLVADADRVVNANDALFGTAGGAVSVIVFALGGATDGTGGVDHMGCDYTTGSAIEVCASFGDSARVSALFEAELSECSMGGNLCGSSTGEALSRWCAAVISGNALADFASASQWQLDGAPNYVDQTAPTDQDIDSTGCGMAFLSWLMSMGHGRDTIAQGMVALGDSGTLAQLYSNLTGNPASTPWPAFQSAIQNLPNGVSSNDPFGGAAQPAQLTHLAPWTVALAGRVFAEILSDIAAGKTANQITASVRAILSSAPNTNAAALAVAACSIRSRRLAAPCKAQVHTAGV